MALIQAFREEERAGFKKGFAGWPLLPYSRMVAILALLSPSDLGSEKPTFTLKSPFLSCRAGDVPRERRSSPVLRDSYFVPLPITACRLERTLSSTTSAPASSTFGRISSVLSASRDTFIRKSSGILHVALATWFHLLYQYFQIHPPAFDILHRSNLKGMPVTEDAHIGCDRNAGYHAELKKVGGSGKGCHVGPFLTAVPAFPVSAYLCHGHIRFRLKALIILRELFFHNGDEGVHLSKAHVTPSSSSQTPYRSFPLGHEKLAHSVVPPLPKKPYGFPGTPLVLNAPVSVEPKQKVDRVPDLLCRVCVISKESARGTVPGLIEMRCQHDHRLFGGGRHRILRVIALLDMLVALRVGNSGGDVALQKRVIHRMFQNQVCFDFFQQSVHHRRPLP
nr:MAG TPA: hypothetical protein [Caudoviricetes sp.]DAO39360.1 MAG TPA: hypothetical protein [Caudoviricetes sp.]